MLAYHFTNNKLRDGRPIPKVGEKLVHRGELIPCKQGLHASKHPFDALTYAPGNMLHLVKLGGLIIEHNKDKVVASERTIIKTIDAEKLLRKFACDQALSVKHLWDMPKAVETYLTTQDPELRDAARNATRNATWDATRAATRDAAWAAARYAARDAAREDAKVEFKHLVEKEMEL